MSQRILWTAALAAAFVLGACAGSADEKGEAKMFEKDLIDTDADPLEITLIGHGTLMFEFAGKVVHVDPWTNLADYADLPKADLLLVTHDHRDHLDPEAIALVRKEGTVVMAPEKCAPRIPGAEVIGHGDVREALGIQVEAVPAYNIVHKRPTGEPFHPKGEGNGYVLTFGGKRVYVAGDTEDIPEMRALQGIDVAFLPMNLPYTMTPAMVADAARAFRPRILYPYHYGKTDTGELVALLEGEKDIEVRIRKMD